MIPRYQRILFWVLLLSSLGMASYLLYLHHRASAANHPNGENTPIAAPETTAAENVTFLLARDDDGSIIPTDESVALPSVPAVRARALLEHLLAGYALPESAHPLPGGIAVDDVFLLPLPLTPPRKTSAEEKARKPQLPTAVEDADPLTHASGELAVVNLRSSWADTHPSGVEAEALTIQSIIGTLHADMPEITYVRFLVDGQPRNTLAGHVNLQRVYPSTDTATSRH